MDNLIVDPTHKTPKVELNMDNGKFVISGRSIPEDARDFYEPIKKWLENYFRRETESTSFVFEIYYFNTASSKMILDIFYIIKHAVEKKHEVKVIWGVEKNDEEMLEAGEDYAAIVNIPFEFKTIDVEDY
jgi:SiaC family regulatory phosphoprotein